MPGQCKYYSVNEAPRRRSPRLSHLPRPTPLLKAPWGIVRLRYIGSLVADFHRTLLKGGVFLDPPTERLPRGKLRRSRANPSRFLAEQARRPPTDGNPLLLEQPPRNRHRGTPLIVAIMMRARRCALSRVVGGVGGVWGGVGGTAWPNGRLSRFLQL